MIKKLFHKLNDNAVQLRKKTILELIDKNPKAKVIDLGCDDGSWTKTLQNQIHAQEIWGIEIIDERLKKAQKLGVKVVKSDLNNVLPFPSESFDIVHADQVIEHVSNLDMFTSEIFRILKPKGFVIISTENGSSWHNIFASILGWQIFSLTNISSKKSGIGNPLAIHRGKKIDLSSWTHKTVFNYRGLKEFFETHGFKEIQIKGAGYHPLPAWVGKIDPRHSHYITLKAYK